MGKIQAHAARPHPVATTASVDTVELVLRRPFAGLRKQVGAVVGARCEIGDIVDRTGHWRGVRVIINRPSRSALRYLSRLVNNRWLGCCVSRVDVAVDFRAREDEADALLDWLDQHVILKWRSATSRKVRIGRRGGRTIYWANGRRARNLVVYRKAVNVVRLELRFFDAGSVKRAGLDNLDALAHLDVKGLINHNIKAEMPTERRVTNAVRRTYKEDMSRHQRETRRYQPVVDRYRSRIPARVRSMLSERIDAQTLRTRMRTDTISTDWLGIPDHLSLP